MEGNQSSGLMCPNAPSGNGSGRGVSGGGGGLGCQWSGCGRVGGTSPSKMSTSGRTRNTSRPTWIPFGRTTRACTVPLAKKEPPDGLIFISLIVTLRRIFGGGLGEGKVASALMSGKRRGEDIRTVFGCAER